MAFAHSQGVIHRDLKPANVMVGQFGETVVLDWGLAKVRGKKDLRADDLLRQVQQLREGDGARTVAGLALGTPSYMSPEQAGGKVEEVDERSDVWGLGALLYELLTGRAPFIGGNPIHIVAQVRSEEVVSPARRCPEAPRELVAIAEKALQRDRARRYASAAEMAEEVSAYMTGRRVAAYRYSSWELLTRFAARNKAALAAAALVALTVVVALVLVSLAWQRAAAARDRERQQSLQAHYTLAQAYGHQADQLHLQDKSLASQVFGQASLLNNPANPFSPHAQSGFAAQHPGASRWVVRAASRVYQSRRGPLEALAQRLPHEDALMEAVFAPHGQLLATVEYGQGLTVRDLSRDEILLRAAEAGEVSYGVAWFPDGQRLATCGKNPALRTWDLASGQALLSIDDVGPRSLAGIAVSPDGRHLATAAGDGSQLALWDAQSGAQLLSFVAHQERVTSQDFSPDGRLLASSGLDGAVRLWDAASGRLVRSLSEGEGLVFTVRFSPDGQRLLAAATDHAARIWDVASGQLLAELRQHDDRFYYADFSPDGRRVATAGAHGELRLWRAEDGQQLALEEVHAGAICSVSFSAEGGLLASAGYDKLLRLWQLRPLEGRLPALPEEMTALATSPEGERLAGVGPDGVLRVWSLPGGELLSSHPLAADQKDLAWSPDGRWLATGGMDQQVHLLDVPQGQLRSLAGHQGTVRALAFSPDGKWLASASADKTARLWDPDSGDQLASMEDSEVFLDTLAFSADGRQLASAGGSGRVLRWQLPEGELAGSAEPHQDWITALAWLPDGSLISAGRDGLALRWEPEGAQILQRFQAHEQAIETMALHAPAQRLATQDRAGTLIIWDLLTAEPRLWLLREPVVGALCFAPDGSSLFSTTGRSLERYAMDFGAADGFSTVMLDAAERAAGRKLEGFRLVAPDEVPSSP